MTTKYRYSTQKCDVTDAHVKEVALIISWVIIFNTIIGAVVTGFIVITKLIRIGFRYFKRGHKK